MTDRKKKTFEEKTAENADCKEKNPDTECDCEEKSCDDAAECCDSSAASSEKDGEKPSTGGASSSTSTDDMNEKYLRLMADFQNQRKRFDKEKADIYQYANEDIVKNLLEVLDNFDRALDAATDADTKLLEGMELIFKQFWEALEKAGVSEIKALGEDFDPNFHNAVMMEDSSEHASGKVSDVLQKGYSLNGRVIRPSMVKVAN